MNFIDFIFYPIYSYSIFFFLVCLELEQFQCCLAFSLHADCEFCVYTVQSVHIFATLCFNFA